MPKSKGLSKVVRPDSDARASLDSSHRDTRPPSADFVQMSIQVPRFHRDHWQAEARRRGLTVSDLVRDYLKSHFGLPD